ncbi:MAG: GxxExxY protein [Chthoniobacteraceae bacterium]
MKRDQIDQLATRVLDAAFEVHRLLGPGLLENAYEMALCHELSLAGISFERQKPLAVVYKGVNLDCGYRLDVLIEDTLVLELKSCDQLIPIHEATFLNYLKLSGCPLGYLINFNVRLLKNGIKRIANQLSEE